MTWSPQSTLADLLQQDYDELDIFCAGCRGTIVKPLHFLSKYWHPDETLEQITTRLRCARCNERPTRAA